MSLTTPEHLVYVEDLTNRDAVYITGNHEDGRKVHLLISIFSSKGDFAYGSTSVAEQKEPGSDATEPVDEFYRYIARLPLENTIEPGSFNLDVRPDSAPLLTALAGRMTQSLTAKAKKPTLFAWEQGKWEPLPVVCEELSVIEHDPNGVLPWLVSASFLQKATTAGTPLPTARSVVTRPPITSFGEFHDLLKRRH